MSLHNITRESPTVAAETLKNIFKESVDKRICIVGASCVGKTTLLKYLPEAVDMDDLLFGKKEKNIKPLLTQSEIDYVCGTWTPEIGEFMAKKSRELITIEKGRPVFGTIVFSCDLIIEITVPDSILRERIKRRNGNETDVFRMKAQIESEIALSGIKKIVVHNV